jgi:hypothetical protein
VLGYTRLPGSFTVPAVAYDGSASGLSADGKTLILIEPRARFPRARTVLAVLDAKRLVLHKVVTLAGDYSFDAISAGGTTMFLIQYTSAKDPTRYEVRAYDVRGGRLFPNSVVDPHEDQDAMRGSPITRATSPNGRWAYTLYDGAGGTPFVHALDTEKRQARCIDLAVLVGRNDLWRLRLSVLHSGLSLAVGTPRHAVALIDTNNFSVTAPGRRAEANTSSLYDTRRWLLLAIAVLATIATVLAVSVAVRRLRARLARVQHV